jgi:signal transduction histidine kinase
MTVSDEGPGIPEEDHDTIFDRYQRGPTRAPGSGLGLHISRQLVRAMGGEIRLEPNPRRGASFVVELPLA